jgi:uncharacterized lipoprotein YajG
MKAVLVVLVAALALGGCALTTATLDLGAPGTDAPRGPLAAVPAMDVAVGPFVDKRSETAVVGYKRNGFGNRMGAIKSNKPVSDLVREAVATEFSRHGHRVGADSRTALEGEITTFWTDGQIGFATIDLLGSISITLAAIDRSTGARLYSRSYHAEHTETVMFGTDGALERALNRAMEKLVRDVASDIGLLRVLRERAVATR